MTNREAFTGAIAKLRSELRRSTEGGGDAYRKRHLERGKLLPRERVEMLLDENSYFWSARKVTRNTGSDLESFVELIGGVSSGEKALATEDSPDGTAGRYKRRSAEFATSLSDAARSQGKSSWVITGVTQGSTAHSGFLSGATRPPEETPAPANRPRGEPCLVPENPFYQLLLPIQPKRINRSVQFYETIESELI